MLREPLIELKETLKLFSLKTQKMMVFNNNFYFYTFELYKSYSKDEIQLRKHTEKPKNDKYLN